MAVAQAKATRMRLMLGEGQKMYLEIVWPSIIATGKQCERLTHGSMHSTLESLMILACHSCISPQRLAMPDKSPSKLPSGVAALKLQKGVVVTAQPLQILHQCKHA